MPGSLAEYYRITSISEVKDRGGSSGALGLDDHSTVTNRGRRRTQVQWRSVDLCTQNKGRVDFLQMRRDRRIDRTADRNGGSMNP